VCFVEVKSVISRGQPDHTGSAKHNTRTASPHLHKFTIAHEIKNQFFIHESLIVAYLAIVDVRKHTSA